MRPKKRRLVSRKETSAGSARRTQTVPIPLSASESVTLNGSFPLSESAWEQLLRILEVLKPGLVMPPLSLHTDNRHQGTPAGASARRWE